LNEICRWTNQTPCGFPTQVISALGHRAAAWTPCKRCESQNETACQTSGRCVRPKRKLVCVEAMAGETRSLGF
ncbi:hypothetical protein, partial [Chamaesiphon sp. OTE_20_metabat_361]|uniref:hypothetical protein n=1 Tax=Chamaesiphon sp. OTE_20_metabat_361 TaxID=2964689 RepID=UPI00286C5121